MRNLNENTRGAMNRVYLAGPDVFRPNAVEIFAARVRLCDGLRLEAVIPLDETPTTAQAIFAGNVRLIGSADAVIADITPFRGPHCDVGTAWEIGYASARGVPVFAYSRDTRPLTRRVPGTNGRDRDGCLIEDFGLAENLMIAGALADPTIHAGFADAAAAAARFLAGGTRG